MSNTVISDETRKAVAKDAGTKDDFQTQAVGHVPTPGSNTGKGGKSVLNRLLNLDL